MMEVKNFTSVRRTMSISKLIREDYNLTHTKQMIHYAEKPGLSAREREEGLLRTIAEIDLVARENLSDDFYAALRPNLDCARRDIRGKDYWGAIMDISTVETIFLQDYLPELPNLDRQTFAEIFLMKKLVEGIGGRFEIERYEEPEDPADWWKG